MNELLVKYFVIEVEGEVAKTFPCASMPDGSMFELIEAALSSNPVFRLVDKAHVGEIWNGEGYSESL